MTTLQFTVFGIAQPQGSARAFTYRRKPEKGGGFGARVDTDNKHLKAWRREVATEASRMMRGTALFAKDVPIRICAGFYFERPKTVKRRAVTVPPDSDKLARGILDAMTGVVYHDDAQVTELQVVKRYTAVGAPPYAVISVQPLDAAEGRLFT